MAPMKPTRSLKNGRMRACRGTQAMVQPVFLLENHDMQQRLNAFEERGRQLTTTVVTQTMEVRETSFRGLMGKRPYNGRTGTNSQRRAVTRGNSMIRDSSTNIMNGCLHVRDSLLTAALNSGNVADQVRQEASGV